MELIKFKKQKFMKKISTILMLVAVIFITSCNNDSKKDELVEPTTETNVDEKAKIEEKEYVISNSESIVKWSAQGVGHGHVGNVNIVAGKLKIENGVVPNGKITIDLRSMTCTDIKDAGENKDLIDHLKGADFFNVAEFPTASLEFIDATDMKNVKANMTIKDKTEEIIFPITISQENGKVILSSKLKIDRTKFGITYNSTNFFENLKDRAISDEINFEIKLIAK